MLEGSQPDPTPPEAGGEPAAPAEPTQGEVEAAVNPPQTVEEVEAIWRNRVSGKDRAHAAETATLRQQIEEYKTRLTQKEVTDLEGASDAEQWKARYEAEQQRADAAERQRLVDVRMAKYGAAAETLDEATIASMDEAKLAALNARLSGDDPVRVIPIDPNAAPKRPSTPPAAPREKSVAELESDLAKYAPEMTDLLNQR